MDIKNFVQENLKGILKENFFIVDIKVSNSNKITIKLDNEKGILLSECQKIHKELYPLIENEIEDFELEISSPGLTGSLRVWQQYKKIIGKKIDIHTKDDKTISGIIKDANESEVLIIMPDNQEVKINYNNIKKAKQIIEF